MADADNLTDSLGTITEYTHQLGHEIVNPVADEDEGVEYRGFDVQHHSGFNYTTVVSDDRLYGFVQFESDIGGQLAQNLPDETSQPLQQAHAMLDERYADQLEHCRPKLRELLHGDNAFGQLYETDNGTICGLTVNRRYYPAGEDFSLGRYSDCVRTVVLTGRAAVEHLSSETDISEEEIDANTVEAATGSTDIKGFQ